MIIPISKNRQIKVMKLEYQLQKLVKNNGKMVWKPYKFCASIGGAMRILYQEGLADSEATSFQEAIDESRRIVTELGNALAPTWNIRVVDGEGNEA